MKNVIRFPLVAATLMSMVSSFIAHAEVDGTFDTSFAGTGRIAFAGDHLNPGNFSSVNDIITESNGNLLLGGRASAPNGSIKYWWLGELAVSGQFVPTFGSSDGFGRRSLCPTMGNANFCLQYSAMALQPDGRILLLAAPVLTRMTTQAHALDLGGVAGGVGYVSHVNTQINNVQGRFTSVSSMALQPNGKVLLSGGGYYSAATSANSNFAVIRLNTDLSFDGTFNAATDPQNVTFAGGQLVPFDLGGTSADTVLGTLLRPDERILLIGTADSVAGPVLALASLTNTGALDSTFGGGPGKTTWTWNLGSLVLPATFLTQPSMLVDRAGRVLVAMLGQKTSNSTIGTLIVRFNPDGSPDSSFGTSGTTFISALPNCAVGSLPVVNTVAIDSAGRIMAAGFCGSQIAAVRLHGDDGSIDANFSWLPSVFAPASTMDSANTVVFDLAGRLLFGGFSTNGGVRQAGVARLNYDLIFTNNLEDKPSGRLSGQ